MNRAPDDPPLLTDEELDALYERDPLEAMRISRRQVALLREMDRARAFDPDLPEPTPEAVGLLLEQARAILRRDGGDLELVALEDSRLTVRMTGACAACPRSALDLKLVVERVVRARFPQITTIDRIP